MSSQPVTLTDIINKWKNLVTGSAVTRWDEMEAFFQDAAEAKIPAKDIIRRKDAILRVWVDLTWQEAQKNHPNWKEKAYWLHRKEGTIKTFDKWYAEYAKEHAPEEQKKQTVSAPPVEDMPVFDNLEDFQAWKARKKGVG